jgi:hypothetical protein
MIESPKARMLKGLWVCAKADLGDKVTIPNNKVARKNDKVNNLSFVDTTMNSYRLETNCRMWKPRLYRLKQLTLFHYQLSGKYIK